VDFLYGSDRENGSIAEAVFFGKAESVSDHRVQDARSVKRFKRVPFDADRIKFTLVFGVFGTALVQLLGHRNSASKHVKTKAALSPHVAKTLVLWGQGSKEESELRGIRADVKGLAKHGGIGDSVGGKTCEQANLARSAQRIEELRAVARFPSIPNVGSDHLGAKAAHSAVDTEHLATDPRIVQQGKSGIRQFTGLTHALQRVALGCSGCTGFVAEKLRCQWSVC
jgi:hypothetical protein